MLLLTRTRARARAPSRQDRAAKRTVAACCCRSVAAADECGCARALPRAVSPTIGDRHHTDLNNPPFTSYRSRHCRCAAAAVLCCLESRRGRAAGSQLALWPSGGTARINISVAPNRTASRPKQDSRKSYS